MVQPGSTPQSFNKWHPQAAMQAKSVAAGQEDSLHIVNVQV